MELLQTLISVLHVLTCLTLIVTVLLQAGRGGGLGGGLGGAGAAQVFGGRGAGGFLLKGTVGASVFFLITSLALARFSSEPQSALDLSGGSQAQSANEDPIMEEGTLPWDDNAAVVPPAPSDAPVIPVDAPVIKINEAPAAPAEAPAAPAAPAEAPAAPAEAPAAPAAPAANP